MCFLSSARSCYGFLRTCSMIYYDPNIRVRQPFPCHANRRPHPPPFVTAGCTHHRKSKSSQPLRTAETSSHNQPKPFAGLKNAGQFERKWLRLSAYAEINRRLCRICVRNYNLRIYVLRRVHR